MKLKDPIIAYTAETNLEAHLIVEMLVNSGVPAYAVEDNTGVWAWGTSTQINKPDVWIDKSTLEKAMPLLLEFEERKRNRNDPGDAKGEIHVQCEECGKTTVFPKSLIGTTQDCSHCGSYVDVGDLPWEDDYGEPEE